MGATWGPSHLLFLNKPLDAGNTLTYGTVTLTYNARGRAKTVKNGSVTEALVYNALGGDPE